MTLQEFKTVHGLETINFGQNPETGRYIATPVSNKTKQELRIISKPASEFDAKKPIYVYSVDVENEDGTKVVLHVLSNKAPQIKLTL